MAEMGGERFRDAVVSISISFKSGKKDSSLVRPNILACPKMSPA